MNEAQTLQASRMPDWMPNEVKVVYMTYVIDDPQLSSIDSIKCVKTLAASLDEAVKRCETEYGSGHLNAWSAARLPLNSWTVGGGHLLASKHDKNHLKDLYRMGYGSEFANQEAE